MVTGKLLEWRLYLVLLVMSIFGVAALFPFTLAVQQGLLEDLGISLPVLIIAQLVQNAIFLGIVIFFGLILSKKAGFDMPFLRNWIVGRNGVSGFNRIAWVSVLAGVVTGVVILLSDLLFRFFGGSLSFEGASSFIWEGFLASFYGGIVEEIIMRLFVMSLIVWVLLKISGRPAGSPSALQVWVGIVLAAVIFGLGHLPFTSTLVDITPFIVFRALLLNGIGGVVFGWLFWKKGLEAAMIAHFMTDIVLLVVFPLISLLFI